MGRAKEAWMRQTDLGWSPGSDSYVCGNCLNDEALAEIVSENADSHECDFCGKKRKKPFAAPLDTVTEHMALCINREYTDPANELPYESREGGYQGTVLDAWELLEEIGFEVDSEELLDEVRAAFDGQGWCEKDFFALSAVDRQKNGWDRFKRAVKHERRFTFWSMGDDEAEEFHPDYLPVGKMLAEIGEAVNDAGLVKPLKNGTSLWRVRVHDLGTLIERDDQLSPPPVAKAKQPNRMSPAGIAMFYGAEDFATARIETVDSGRDLGKQVTGACFTTLKELRILDLFDLPRVPSFFALSSADLRHKMAFLHHFVRDVTVPILHDGSEHIEYLPTQAFTEYVRFEMKTRDDLPIDGIRYRSSRNRLPSLVLFCGQDDCVEIVDFRKREQWLKFDAKSLRTEPI